jgi:hypothetical protein
MKSKFIKIRATRRKFFIMGFLAGLGFGYLFGLWQQLAQRELRNKKIMHQTDK